MVKMICAFIPYSWPNNGSGQSDWKMKRIGFEKGMIQREKKDSIRGMKG
jgi:hypothetical protein